jgi:hypothetical protein
MPVLTALKKDRLGEWTTVADYLADLRRRETNSVAALGLLLAAMPEEQRELAEGKGLAILVEVASDLRIPKASRLAAARCAIEAGAAGDDAGSLFVGAGDLATDPRLGNCAKRLVEAGMPAALRMSATHGVSLEAGWFALAAHAAASVAGRVRVEEMLAPAPASHAGKVAAAFAIGLSPLPQAHQEKWSKLLRELCAAHRRAPAAARRLGLVQPWPPNLPEAFAPLVREAEEAAAHVTSQDVPTGEVKRAPAPAGSTPSSARTGGAPADPAHVAGPPAASQISLPRTPSRATLTEVGKKMAPPIRPSLFRRPTGTVSEGPRSPTPKAMAELRPRGGRAAAARMPANPPPHASAAPSPRVEPEPAPLRRARPADGPFAARLASLFDDRPEAVERLCAAIEARAALEGLAAALAELEREVSRARWKERRPTREQLDRLAAAQRAGHEAWSAAAQLLLGRL